MRLQLRRIAPAFSFMLALVGALAMLSHSKSAEAFEIMEIESESGIEAWLVEDYTNPIITVSASFRGGAVQDPPDKPGLASLMSALFDEGAGPYDSSEFQARLEKLGIDLSYRDRREKFTVTLRTLVSDASEAFEMLRLTLTELRFDDAAIERMRNALRAQLLRQQNQPRTEARQALRRNLFGDHPYSRPTDGTLEGLDRIERADLVEQFERIFARDNVRIGIVGAISPQDARQMLDRVFSGLPETAKLQEIPVAEPQFGAELTIEEQTPQARITMALPGVARDSEDFFAAYLMNHILGGGTFSSRLYNAVREERGLAYSIASNLTTLDKAAFLALGTSTSADQISETLAVIRSEIEKMARQGPTAEELESAKKYVLGAYAINNLDTSSNIAQTLVALQEEGLGRDYLTEREAMISAVTLEEVRAVARKLLSATPTIVVVGPPKA